MLPSKFNEDIERVVTEAGDVGIALRDLAAKVGCSYQRADQWRKTNARRLVTAGKSDTGAVLYAWRTAGASDDVSGEVPKRVESKVTAHELLPEGEWHVTGALELAEGTVYVMVNERGQQVVVLGGDKVREIVARGLADLVA
jgi:hypothetical protein